MALSDNTYIALRKLNRLDQPYAVGASVPGSAFDDEDQIISYLRKNRIELLVSSDEGGGASPTPGGGDGPLPLVEPPLLQLPQPAIEISRSYQPWSNYNGRKVASSTAIFALTSPWIALSAMTGGAVTAPIVLKHSSFFIEQILSWNNGDVVPGSGSLSLVSSNDVDLTIDGNNSNADLIDLDYMPIDGSAPAWVEQMSDWFKLNHPGLYRMSLYVEYTTP